MKIQETKNKLEFERIINRIKHHTYSDLGIEKCDEIDFFTDRALLENELDKVAEIREILNAAGDIPLDGLKDIRASINKMKIEGHFISPAEFLGILEFLRVSRKIKKLISDINQKEGDDFKLIHGITTNLFYDKILEHNIEITIDENGEVKDNASAALNKIRKQINAQSGKTKKITRQHFEEGF